MDSTNSYGTGRAEFQYTVKSGVAGDALVAVPLEIDAEH
jgi:hypothetical protein